MADAPDTERGDELRAWALGSFHVAVLTVVALLSVHSSGALGDLLRGLDTATGVVLYLVVWAAGWLATRAALARAPLDGNVAAALGQGVIWGGAAGVAALLVGLLVVAAPGLLTRGAPLSAFALITGIGGTVALVAGAVVGGLFALLDVALTRLAERLAPTEA